VGELYVPLNVSKDGDGEPTGQQGLRERFDSRLMDSLRRQAEGPDYERGLPSTVRPSTRSPFR
jgi:hypothetical protein